MSFFKKIWDAIKKLLTKLWEVLRKVLAVLAILAAIYFLVTGQFWLAALLLGAAFLLDPEMTTGLIQKVGSAVSGLAGVVGGVVGDVIGAGVSGILSSPFGLLLIAGAAFWLLSGDDDEEDDESSRGAIGYSGMEYIGLENQRGSVTA